MNRFALALLAAMVLAPVAPPARAEDYPSKPIRIVVGFPPGGITDVLARILSAEMQKDWGQPIIVENRPGASGIIGAENVARAQPDGYALLVVAGNHTINPAIRAQMPFDAVKSFTAITLLASAPNMLVVRADSPVKDVNGYVAAAKAKPGEVTYATSGIATTVHIAGEQLARLTGAKFSHIPYKGSAASVEALLGGQVASSWSAVNAALPHIKSGRLRALAVASPQRSTFVPDVPTFEELGVKGMKSDTWLGVLGPSNMPVPVAQKLSAYYVKLIARPDIRDKLLALGAEPVGLELDGYAQLMREEVELYTQIVKAAGIKPE